MKKLLALCLIAVMAVSMFAGCAPAAVEEPAPAPEAEAEAPEVEEGKEYHIRVSINSAYRGQTFVDAGEILNEQLKAEGSKDTVSVEWIEVKENDDSLPIFHAEGNMPEMICNAKAGLFRMYDAGYLVDASDVVNDEVYAEHTTQAMRDLLLSPDGTYYPGIIYESDSYGVMIYKPALAQLGWTEDQINQWKTDAREGKVTVDDLIAVAEQIVEKDICEYGIMHRDSNSVNNYFGYVTWNDGVVPVTEDNKAVIDKNSIFDWLTFYRTIVQKGLTPYNLTTDFSREMLDGDILPNGEAFAYYCHIDTKSRMMTNADVTSDYVDENYFMIPNPVNKLGDKPAVGANPWGIGLTYSSQEDPKMAEYCKRLCDIIISTPEIQLDVSVRSGHIPVSKAVTEMDEYKADKWMSDLDYIDKYVFSFPVNKNINSYYSDSANMWAAIQEAMIDANKPDARDIKTIVDETVEKITFEMLEDPGYVIVDWE